MISDPSLILYACISKGKMILAELTFGDHDLETLALQCLEKTPNLHENFSQTTANRSYSFLMDDPFVYFAILKQDLSESQGIQFLEFVKEEFIKILKNKSINIFDDLTPHCFQEEFDPVFHRLVSSSDELSPVSLSPDAISRDYSRNGSLDSRSSGNRVFSTPLLGRSSKSWKKKKKKRREEFAERQVVNVSSSNGGNLNREISMKNKNNNNGGYIEQMRNQEAQERHWRDNVRIILLIDLAFCCLLFLVWLSICKGFDCLAN